MLDQIPASVSKRNRQAYAKKWWVENRDRVLPGKRLYQRARRAANPEEHKRRSREWNIRQYGITIEQYNELLARQDGHCALCTSTKRLSIDHSHETGQVRGILCTKCNYAVAVLGDNFAGILRVLSYFGGI